MKVVFFFLSILIIIVSCDSRENANKSISVNKKSKEADSIIYCKGIFKAPENDKIAVTPFIGGIVRKIYTHTGDTVQKGEKLALLQHQDYIDLQIEYLELYHWLDFYKEDYKRQGELTIENAASIKKMQKSKANFSKVESRFTGIEKKLDLLGINKAKVLKTGPVDKIFLYSPQNGIIRNVKMITGEYLDNKTALCKISLTGNLLIDIKVRQEFYHNFNDKSKIIFSLTGDTAEYSAEFILIYPFINEGMITAIAKPDINNQFFIEGREVSAKIIKGKDD